jgi:hypothetical protein
MPHFIAKWTAEVVWLHRQLELHCVRQRTYLTCLSNGTERPRSGLS